MVAKRFLEDTDCEVLLMIDHDLDWVGPNPALGYEGDLLHVSRQCAQTKGIVGAFVSKKVKGQGVASMIKSDATVQLGQTGLYEAHYVGSAFTAYHRDAIEAVSATMSEVIPGFKPIFLPCIVPHPLHEQDIHLSEDWAFCHRAEELGFKSYLSSKPLITHHGNYGYTVLGDAIPKEEQQPPVVKEDKTKRPIISVLHASRGRPEQLRMSVERYLKKASTQYNVEYIVAVDSDDETVKDIELPENVNLISGSHRGCVDAYNTALYNSSGDIIIQAHDDVDPPQNWDALLVQAAGDYSESKLLHVADGLPEEVNKNSQLMTVLVGTRAYFKECGYFFHPSFVSVYCDDDQSQKAYQEGKVVDAKQILFTHHWAGAGRDETQQRSYSRENWAIGARALKERQKNNFKSEPGLWPQSA